MTEQQLLFSLAGAGEYLYYQVLAASEFPRTRHAIHWFNSPVPGDIVVPIEDEQPIHHLPTSFIFKGFFGGNQMFYSFTLDPAQHLRKAIRWRIDGNYDVCRMPPVIQDFEKINHIVLTWSYLSQWKIYNDQGQDDALIRLNERARLLWYNPSGLYFQGYFRDGEAELSDKGEAFLARPELQYISKFII